MPGSMSLLERLSMPGPRSLWGDEYAWFQVPSGGRWVCPGSGYVQGEGIYTNPVPRHGTWQVHTWY